MIPRTICAALIAVLGSPAAAIDCRLALLLAIDVSSSVDESEDLLQRNGLAAALISPGVQAAFFASDLPVALAVYEWSGRYHQAMLHDWRVIQTRADLLDVAETLARSKRSYNEFPTAMGYALGYGAGVLQNAPACLQQTLDMAGDGINNEGFRPAAAYAEFPFAGVTVNGLVVNAADSESEISLLTFYQTEVIRGPGAFMEVAQGFDDYERAMRRKLERELAVKVIGSVDLPAPNGPG